MLVLTRTEEQEIRIGADVTIKVLAIHGGQVRLGIEAPRDIAIRRGELVEAVAQQNEAARRTAEAPADALRVLAAELQQGVYTARPHPVSSRAEPSPITPHGQRDPSADRLP